MISLLFCEHHSLQIRGRTTASHVFLIKYDAGKDQLK
jgi:hypothetical protein